MCGRRSRSDHTRQWGSGLGRSQRRSSRKRYFGSGRQSTSVALEREKVVASRKMKARFTVRTVLLHITLVVVGVSLSLANEVIPIGTILKDAESYNLRVV